MPWQGLRPAARFLADVHNGCDRSTDGRPKSGKQAIDETSVVRRHLVEKRDLREADVFNDQGQRDHVALVGVDVSRAVITLLY